MKKYSANPHATRSMPCIDFLQTRWTPEQQRPRRAAPMTPDHKRRTILAMLSGSGQTRPRQEGKATVTSASPTSYSSDLPQARSKQSPVTPPSPTECATTTPAAQCTTCTTATRVQRCWTNGTATRSVPTIAIPVPALQHRTPRACCRRRPPHARENVPRVGWTVLIMRTFAMDAALAEPLPITVAALITHWNGNTHRATVS